MEGTLPWLVRWARHAGTRDIYPALAALVRPSTKYVFFLTVIHYFILCAPHRPATWAGSRAGPPLSKYASPVGNLGNKGKTLGLQLHHRITFEALNLLLLIFLHLCSRNSATWQWHSVLSRTQSSARVLPEFCHGWPLVISITSCKVQMLYATSLC
jgi:hypothetical protein